MKKFLKTFISSLLGVLAAMFCFSVIAVCVAMSLASVFSSKKYNLKENTVLKLDFNGSLNDRATSSLFGSIMGEGKSIAIDDMIKSIEIAKNNPKVKAIYISNTSLQTGPGFLEPIRAALINFKESGKPIIAYGDYYTQACYYLSSMADKIIMNPEGSLHLKGLAANMKFSKNHYDKLGIHYQAFKVGTFKSAIEPYIETKMSDANKQQVTSYLNSLWEHWLKGISTSRNIPIDSLKRYADEYLAYSKSSKTIEYKMIDTLMYKQDIEAYLKQVINTDDKLQIASVEEFSSIPAEKKKNNPKEKIAVLYADGAIVSDQSQGVFSLLGNVISSDEYIKELTRLKDDDDVKAVVFRINSGGGSAYASEQIWKSVIELKKKKPIVVSMGNFAASGGYYIACAANKIIAEPTTLTGSIGVFMLVPEGKEMHEKIGWSFDEVSTNQHSTMGIMSHIPFLTSATRPFSDAEKNLIQASVERTYDLFLTRCAEGRSKSKTDIDAIGQGRVWTGIQALNIGLVDELGGIDAAIKAAAQYADLQQYNVVSYPEPKGFIDQFRDGSKGSNIKAALTKCVLGDDVYRQYMLTTTTPMLNEFVMALMTSDLQEGL